MNDNELTREQAAALGETEWWKGLDCRAVAGFQLFTKRLCMPFSEFQGAVEQALGRPVWTHEFGAQNRLQDEFLGHRPKPSFTDIMSLIPKDKLIIVIVDTKES